MRRLVGPVGLGIALSVGAAFTTAFTTGSEVVTAAAIGVFVVAQIVAVRRRPTGPCVRPLANGSGAVVAEGSGATARGVAIWGGVAAVAIAFELWNYFLSPRYAHPTVSYFLTAVAGQQWSRGVLFAAWLALGGYLVSR